MSATARAQWPPAAVTSLCGAVIRAAWRPGKRHGTLGRTCVRRSAITGRAIGSGAIKMRRSLAEWDDAGMHVSEAGARRLVERAIREGHNVADHAPHRRVATEDTGHVARRLVDAIKDRLQTGKTSRSRYEETLLAELALRDTRSSAVAFAAAAEAEWIRQHETGYPASALPVEARQGPHGSPGHVCWQALATV